MSISKIELKKQLQEMGITVVEGNYIKKTDIKNVIGEATDSNVDTLIQISEEINRLWNKEDDLFIKLEDGIKEILTHDMSPLYAKLLENILKNLADRINSYPKLLPQIRRLTPYLKALKDEI